MSDPAQPRPNLHQNDKKKRGGRRTKNTTKKASFSCDQNLTGVTVHFEGALAHELHHGLPCERTRSVHRCDLGKRKRREAMSKTGKASGAWSAAVAGMIGMSLTVLAVAATDEVPAVASAPVSTAPAKPSRPVSAPALVVSARAEPCHAAPHEGQQVGSHVPSMRSCSRSCARSTSSLRPMRTAQRSSAAPRSTPGASCRRPKK